MTNALKLLAITLVTLVVSGYLFYEGLKPELQNIGLFNEVENKTVDIGTSTESAVLGEENQNTANEAQVLGVTDGDTIEVSYQGKKTKLRFIGINTPETVDPRRPVECFGKEASNENKRLLEGKKIILEKDISETDKFDRLLRYVYLPLDDGTKLFVNDYLVRQGFALADTFPPDVKYSERFKLAQRQAEENLRGLWSACPLQAK